MKLGKHFDTWPKRLAAIGLGCILILMLLPLFGVGILSGLGMLAGAALLTQCSDVPDYTCDPCARPERGRIDAVAFVAVDYYPTLMAAGPTLYQTWVDAVALGKAYMIPNVRGTYDGGSPVTAEGYGRQETRNTGRDHSLNYMDLRSVDNADFYNALNGSQSYTVFYATESKIWNIGGAVVTVNAGAPVEASTNSEVMQNVTVTWSNPLNPLPYNQPGTAFRECLQNSGSVNPNEPCTPQDVDFSADIDWDNVSTNAAATYTDYTYPVDLVRTCCTDAVLVSIVDTNAPATNPTSLDSGRLQLLTTSIPGSSANVVLRVFNTYTNPTANHRLRFRACGVTREILIGSFETAVINNGLSFGFSVGTPVVSNAGPPNEYSVTFPVVINNGFVESADTPNFTLAFGALTIPGVTLVTTQIANTGPGVINGNVVVNVNTAVTGWDAEAPLQLVVTGDVARAEYLGWEPCVVRQFVQAFEATILNAPTVLTYTLATGVTSANSFDVTRKCYNASQRNMQVLAANSTIPAGLDVFVENAPNPDVQLPNAGGYEQVGLTGPYSLSFADSGPVTPGTYVLVIELWDTEAVTTNDVFAYLTVAVTVV